MPERICTDDKPPVRLGDFLSHSGPLLPTFRLRMNQIADDARWLGGFFHAAAIILQLPGGADYRPNEKSRLDFFSTICVHDRRRPLGLLLEVLRRLGSETLLAQVPGGDGPTLPPARHVKRRFNKMTQPQLVQVAANCLDRLMVDRVTREQLRYYRGSKAKGKPVAPVCVWCGKINH